MKSKSKKVKNALPAEIYVQVANYGDGKDICEEENCIVASSSKEDALDEDLGSNDSGDVVGVYELKNVVKLTRKIEISEQVIDRC